MTALAPVILVLISAIIWGRLGKPESLLQAATAMLLFFVLAVGMGVVLSTGILLPKF